MPIAPNLRSRLEKLESVLAPAARVFIFTGVPRPDDDDRSDAEQLAQFKSEKGVRENDILVVVTFDDAA
jgi:hypothetical protein